MGKFPVLTWMLAGGCLCGLAVSEVCLVTPKRRELERSEAEAEAIAMGAQPRVLPSGRVLMPDGRIIVPQSK